MPMLSYKAGRAVRRSDESNWVDPVPEKGTLAFELVDDLAQLIWTSREPGSNTEREEYLLFPEDVSVEKVSADSTGRTYVFKFSSSDQRLFYWFQDADSTQYPQFAQAINVFLQHPDSFPGQSTASPTPSPALARAAAASISTDTTSPPLSTAAGIPSTPAPNPHASSSSGGGGSGGVPNAPIANRVGQLMASELGRAAGEPTPSSGRGGATVGAGAGTLGAGAENHQFSREQLGALAALLQGSSVDGSAAAAGAEDAHLTDILTASTITPLLQRSPSLITRLLPHLPADLPLSSPPTADEIHELLSTPQWTEAVASFDAALRTGGLSGVIRSLGVPDRAGQGVGEFLDEVEKQAEGDRMDTE